MDVGGDRATAERMDWAADAVAGPPTPLLFVSVARPYMAGLERSYRTALANDDASGVAVAVEAAAFAQRAVAVFHAIDALYGDGTAEPSGGGGGGRRGSTRGNGSRRSGASASSSLRWTPTGASAGGRSTPGEPPSVAGSAATDRPRRAPASVVAAEQLAAAVRRDDPGRYSPAEAAAVPYLLRAKARLFEAVRSGDRGAVRALTLACEEALEQSVGSGSQFVLTVPGQAPPTGPGAGGGTAGTAAAVGAAGGLLAAPSFGRGGGAETEDVVAAADDSDVEDVAGGIKGRGATSPVDGGGPRSRAAAGCAAARRLLTCELLRVSKTASVVTFLYFLLAIASIAAIVVITVQFADDVRNPESGIELVRHTELAMPTVTVCSTQTGVPLRRLQFFNYTDAAGVRVGGPLPDEKFGTPEFEAVVERFWDNPDGEDCDRICGNFFPLPVRTLQQISNGELSTKCRPCFRTGSQGPEVIARSTAFSAAAFMELYTDHAFFQCMFRENGVDVPAQGKMRESVGNADDAAQFFGATPLAPGDPTPVLTVPATSTRADAIAALGSEELCNVLYFAVLPVRLNQSEPLDADIKYTFDGTGWTRTGDGPYFVPRTSDQVQTGSPEEGLQVFITARDAPLPPGGVTSLADTALLGPNSEVAILFNRRQVDDKPRFAISSISSSNRLVVNIADFSGYWLQYAVHLSYATFVEEQLRDVHTYPVTQWLVDVAGYIGLFTGASLFSIMVVPLLQLLRRRDRRESLAARPLDTLYSPYHVVRASRATPGVMGDLAAPAGGLGGTTGGAAGTGGGGGAAAAAT